MLSAALKKSYFLGMYFRIRAYRNICFIFQIRFLQTAINNLSAQNIDNDVASKFWTKLGQVIQTEIKNASSAVQQMLDEEYPKILKCFYDMYEKLKYDKFVFKWAFHLRFFPFF